MSVTAVVPTRILRKWDVAAAAQLFEAASRIAERAERIEKLEREIDDAWHMVDMERDINRELADRCGAQIGMTIDGNLMVMP